MAADDARMRLAEALMRVGEQDHQAFRDLYALTQAKLFGICIRICGDVQAAEDVLHDVYVTIWRRAGAWEPGRSSPITWLATIARNRAIDWRRAQTIRRTSPLSAAADVADGAPDAQAAMLAVEAATQLHQCLDTLEQRQRDSIRAAFFGGATYAELATMSGVPLGTMKSWVRRGLARLKDCLDDLR